MELSIIIVNWNTRDLLAQCLDSIYAYAPQCTFEVWVVDNASTDGSVELLRAQYPQVHLIVNAENVGFARANNQAIRASSGQYMLLLNSDAMVTPNAVQTLVEFMYGHSDAAIAAPRLLNPDHTLQPSFTRFPSVFDEITLPLDLKFRRFLWDIGTPVQVDCVGGACLLIRRPDLLQIGLLNEQYFMYSEEVDLCWRIRQLNRNVYFVPQAQVIHMGGGSTQQAKAEMVLELYKSRIRFYLTHYGCVRTLAYRTVVVVVSLLKITGWSLVSILGLRSKRNGRNLKIYLRLVQLAGGLDASA